MVKYKAKSTYKDAEVTFLTLGDLGKHTKLLLGRAVEITEVPKELVPHLDEVGAKTTKTTKAKKEEK